VHVALANAKVSSAKNNEVSTLTAREINRKYVDTDRTNKSTSICFYSCRHIFRLFFLSLFFFLIESPQELSLAVRFSILIVKKKNYDTI